MLSVKVAALCLPMCVRACGCAMWCGYGCVWISLWFVLWHLCVHFIYCFACAVGHQFELTTIDRATQRCSECKRLMWYVCSCTADMSSYFDCNCFSVNASLCSLLLWETPTSSLISLFSFSHSSRRYSTCS